MKKYIFPVLLLCTAQVDADQMTAMQSGCLGCHQPAIKTVGPSIKDISAKYKDSADIDKLVATVKSGRVAGQLTWGAIPMPASPAPEAAVRKVIEWMLTQG